MAQQPYLGQPGQPGQRIRRASMELDPGSAAAALYQDAFAASLKAADPLSILLSQQHAGAIAPNGLMPASTGLSESMTLAGTPNGYDNLPLLDVGEDPGPLPVLPRAGRMAGAGVYGGYSGAPGPGAGRQPRPRRHSVTIGYLNQQQQQTALYEGQLPNAFLACAAPPGGRMQLLPPQASPNKQLQGLSQQAMAAQLSGLAGQGGMHHSQQLVGSPAFMPGLANTLQQSQQLGPHGQPLPPPQGLSSANSSSGHLVGLDMPAYGLNGPRMPGHQSGNSRRHSWAPISSAAAAAGYRQFLLQQQQQAMNNLTAQLGDAGALFVNQQQQDQLGLGGLAMPAGNGSFKPDQNDYGDVAALRNGRARMLGPDGNSSAGFSMSSPAPVMPMYNDALAKDQLTQHLQQQLAQLQMQQQQGFSTRMAGPAGSALDPYAEPFVSQASLAQQAAGGLTPNLQGMDVNAFGPALLSAGQAAAALQQELLQQHQSGLGFGYDDLSTMYAPLHVNGVSVDTQLLVSPYADNWDVLGSGSVTSSSGPLTASSSLGSSSVAAATAATALPAGAAMYKQKSIPSSSSSSRNLGAGSSLNSSSSGTSATGSVASVGSSSGHSKASGAAGTAAPAAAAAAASMVASLPPVSKVCSDAPWDLKKALDEDAKVLAAQQQQLQKLIAALEQSKTLQHVHEAEAAAEEASAVSAAAAAAVRAGREPGPDGSQSLFGYQLPDSGDDTWGVSCMPSTEGVAGGSCISQEPSNKLFVGNIGWWVTEEDLLHWFSRFGTVINVKIMYNSRKMHKPKDKWRSREYGFIDYATPEEAAKAIVWMDGVELPDLMKDTCGIIVQYAKPTSTQDGTAAQLTAGAGI